MHRLKDRLDAAISPRDVTSSPSTGLKYVSDRQPPSTPIHWSLVDEVIGYGKVPTHEKVLVIAQYVEGRPTSRSLCPGLNGQCESVLSCLERALKAQ